MGFFDFMYPDGRSHEVTAAQAHTKLQEGGVLIDIRPIFQWNAGHAAEAIHIPEERLIMSEAIHTDGLVILICDDGRRSQAAAERLRRQGIDAKNVHGGMRAWKSSGFSVVRS
ncbi:MAG: rhodanese-like domain-containing protein [Actinomycetaceae bacterium]|nr:rhodanese-like domain-containing protein [Actinomycetaceae bacterium]MDY6082375.1 rhodanese-like domain-containing protein [Actinomycetaceae bacterium]